jgi:hypothetical protein
VTTDLTTIIGPPAPGGVCSARNLLEALTSEQRKGLHDFAAKRLARVAKIPSCQRRLAGTSPDEMVHRAIEAALLDEQQPRKGRRLKAKNCRSTAAFILYLQSVINSQLSNLTRSLETNCEHVPVGDHWENPEAVEPVDLADLLCLIERRDLKAILFVRLRQWAADHAGLLRIIDYWEQHFEASDRIGHRGFDQNLMHRVRLKSREICRGLTQEFHPQATTGREIL